MGSSGLWAGSVFSLFGKFGAAIFKFPAHQKICP